MWSDIYRLYLLLKVFQPSSGIIFNLLSCRSFICWAFISKGIFFLMRWWHLCIGDKYWFRITLELYYIIVEQEQSRYTAEFKTNKLFCFFSEEWIFKTVKFFCEYYLQRFFCVYIKPGRLIVCHFQEFNKKIRILWQPMRLYCLLPINTN